MQPRLLFLLRHKVVALSALALLALTSIAGVSFWRASRALQQSTKQIAASSSLPFQITPVRPVAARFEYLAAPQDYQRAASFGGSLFVCGKSTLVEFDNTGRQTSIWHVGQEIPAAPLTTLVVRRGIGVPELWIGTLGAGVLIYNGQTMRQLLPAAPGMRKVSALLPFSDGRVLIGTPEAGILVTDGKRLERFHPQLENTQVTALAGDEDAVWIGTRADGALLWQGGQIRHFRAELPDPQVLSLATDSGKTWIGTPVGIAEFSGDHVQRRLGEGFFAQALETWGGVLYVGTVDEGVIAISLNGPQSRTVVQNHSVLSPNGPIVSFTRSSDHLLAVTPDGLNSIPSGEEALQHSDTTLTAAHIAALQIDSLDRLWIGYFDRGLDILPIRDAAGKRHFENDQLFCVNRIKESASHHTLAVATANGLVLFDQTGRLRQVLDRESGLIASHVTDVLFSGEGDDMVIATPSGISFILGSRIASVYAFQGLVNNHVYTLSGYEGAARNGRLFAGTLGGFSLLKNQLVEASYTTANSALRQNWITASTEAWGDIYLGTNGSGVMRLISKGETGTELASFREFAPREGRVEINPNAMLFTGKTLYAGTAGRGLAILHEGSERWTFVTAGLPSWNVTALTAKNGALYVGTDNGLVRILERDLP